MTTSRNVFAMALIPTIAVLLSSQRMPAAEIQPAASAVAKDISTKDKAVPASPITPSGAAKKASSDGAHTAEAGSADKKTSPPEKKTTPKEARQYLCRAVYPSVATNIGLVLLLVLSMLLLVTAGRPGEHAHILSLTPAFFFTLGTIYLGLLMFFAIAYDQNLWGFGNTYLRCLGGVVPLGVPWFGALGAVLISLRAVFEYNSESVDAQGNKQRAWDSKYNYWHIARPLMGASLGSVAYLMIVMINTVSSQSDKPFDPDDATKANLIFYYIVAFLVGYREEVFADLLKKITDIVLKSK